MSIYFLFGTLIPLFMNLAFAQDANWILTKASHTPGPNCWNGAMVQAGVLKKHRFTTPEEFQYLLQKNCQPISEPQSGSLGRMWDDRGEVHAFIWVNPQTVYAKHSDGTFEARGYEFMSREEMLKSYLLKKECAMRLNGKNCQRDIEYFECSAPQGDQATQMLQLNKLEHLLHSLVFSSETKIGAGADCSAKGFVKRNQILEEMGNELEVLSQKNIFDGAYLDLWLQSVRYQIGLSQQNISYYRCKQISKEQKYFWYKKVKELIDQQRSLLRGS